MVERVPAADDRAPVAALDAVALVAEPRHELRVHLGDLLGAEPRRPRLVREPVAGHGRRHHVERVLGAPAMGDGVGQGADDLRELGDRAGPAVGDHEGQGVGLGRALVDEVDVEIADDGLELVERVEPLLLLAPVELVAPVGDELGDVVELGSVVPPGAVELIGQPRHLEAAVQVVEHLVGDRDLERPDLAVVAGPARLRHHRQGRQRRHGGQPRNPNQHLVPPVSHRLRLRPHRRRQNPRHHRKRRRHCRRQPRDRPPASPRASRCSRPRLPRLSRPACRRSRPRGCGEPTGLPASPPAARPSTRPPRRSTRPPSGRRGPGNRGQEPQHCGPIGRGRSISPGSPRLRPPHGTRRGRRCRLR